MCFLDTLEPRPEPQPGLEEALPEEALQIIRQYTDEKVQAMLRKLKDHRLIKNEVSVYFAMYKVESSSSSQQFSSTKSNCAQSWRMCVLCSLFLSPFSYLWSLGSELRAHLGSSLAVAVANKVCHSSTTEY